MAQLKLSKIFLMLSFFSFVTTLGIGQVPNGLINSDGASVEGLQIVVLRDHVTSESESNPQFRVELRNTGSHDLVLNVGMMLANGRRQYANAITLLLRLPSRREQHLLLLGPAFIAGRLDPFVVPLPVGAAFAIPVDLAKYAPSGEEPLKFGPGAYVLQAQFQGKRAADSNLDMPGMNLMPYWTGTIVSNKFQFDVGHR